MRGWTRNMLLMPVLLVQALSSCSLIDEPEYDDPVRVKASLAFTLSGDKKSSTRMADNVVQNDPARKPSSLYVIAMQGDKYMPSDITWADPVNMSAADPKPASVLYRSLYCDMVSGVNHCLVYGDVTDAEAPSGIPSQIYNGSLIKSSLNSVVTQSALHNMSFGLESIYESTDTPADATTLATAMTDVANLSAWVGSTNDILKNLRQNFINHGFNLPGSAASVKKWLESLASAAQSYLSNPSGLTEDDKGILTTINEAAAAKVLAIGDISASSYPRNLYLPDGAAALRWVESENAFQPEMQTTTLDNINTVSRFAYPAALYYFVDSPIKTSEEEVNFENLYNTVTTTADKTAWEKVLANEKFNKNYVSAKTKSVALEKPVQYGVAQLHVTLKANETIKDDEDHIITIGSSDFQLTGVIVCGQRPVNYLFEQGSNSDVDAKFIYDSQVKVNCYLSTTQTDVCNTLVLQSFDGEDVNIILEFENKGDQTFKCVDGYVYPGTRFYLAGKVEALRDDLVTESEETHRVFTKDYITTVNTVVTSLAKAYNVLPNLLTSNFEIGVETTPQWIAVTPTVVRME